VAVPKARSLALAFLVGAAVGCVSKPTMHLNHAEITGVELATLPPAFGVLMTVVVDVYNPNGYDVAVRAMRGQTVMNNRYPLPVDFRAPAEGVWLPAKATTSVRVPVIMPLELALTLVREGFQAPSIPYRFTGTADVTATRTFQLEKDNYAVDESGTISQQQMLAVIPASLLGPH
jgi:hypothetical protein